MRAFCGEFGAERITVGGKRPRLSRESAQLRLCALPTEVWVAVLHGAAGCRAKEKEREKRKKERKKTLQHQHLFSGDQLASTFKKKLGRVDGVLAGGRCGGGGITITYSPFASFSFAQLLVQLAVVFRTAGLGDVPPNNWTNSQSKPKPTEPVTLRNVPVYHHGSRAEHVSGGNAA